MKTTIIILLTLLSISAIYGLVILTRKIIAPDNYIPSGKKSDRDWKYYIEPYKYPNCEGCAGCSSCQK